MNIVKTEQGVNKKDDIAVNTLSSLFYSISELAALLGRTKSSVESQLSRYPEFLPPSVKLGHKRLFRKADVHEWIVNLPTEGRSMVA